jgi:hypothetical protein
MSEMYKQVSILIGTCDKYSFLWKDFVCLFNRYWDHELNLVKLFLSETVVAKFDGFQFLTPGSNHSFTDRILYGLERIQTPYVLWLQDDYYFRKKIYKNKFEYYLNFIKNNNVERFGICENSEFYKKEFVSENIWKIKQDSDYSVSLQSSIWNKDFFKRCLVKNENPWEFELNGSKRLNNKNHKIYIETQNPPWYLEAMRKGEYTSWFFDIKKEENL